MASKDQAPLAVEALRLLEEKLSVMREVFATTQEELLLVDLEGLTPLLERKERLFGKIIAIDQQLEGAGGQALQDAPQLVELADLVEAIMENQRALEARMNEERSRLRKELRDFDRQTRLKQYLERQKQTESRVNLKK